MMDAKRRKRINFYKKMIIYIVVAFILLPTVLCVVLFVRLNSLNRRIGELQEKIENVGGLIMGESESTAGQLQFSQGIDEETTNSVNTTPNIPEPTETDAAADAETDGETAETVTDAETETQKAENETKQPSETVYDEQELVAQALAEGRKVVYLTFDDGPSTNTGKLLDILSSYGVKATFFVNYHAGHEADYQRIIEEGHTLAMHTYSHDYTAVYQSVEDFISEVVTLQDYLYDLTGYRSTVFRFPGGSSNQQTKIPIENFIAYLDEENITYFDWNVSSGDGSLGLTKQNVYDNVMNGIAKMNISVVLMHDAANKESTLEAVPDIIEALQQMDALILPITMQTTPVQHNIS